MKQCRLDPVSLCARACVLIGVAALDFSCSGSASPNTSSGAPPLQDRTETGTYSPYHATAQMGNPRYAHEAIRLKNGLTLVTGGSDERGFIAFDTAELFDEVGFNQRQIRPPTITGLWLDTDFEGNAISMEFRRLWHTMTLLPNNKVLLVGGAGNWIRARPIERVEIFDPDTRSFETLEDARMVEPRVRHTANFLPSGQILIAGGQVHDIFSQLVGQTTGGLGQPQSIQINTDIFPSIDLVEVFSFHDLTFNVLTFPESTRPSRLTNVRGRTGHVTVPFAGLDNKLGTNDDLFLLVGGFQTARAADLVPRVMAPRQAGTTAMQNLEVFDPALQAFIQIGTASLNAARVNDPQATNLGIFNDRTPDGVPGLGNVIFVALGDSNGPCWDTPFIDELFSASFSGFGPASGLTFHRILQTNPVENGFFQGQEGMVAGSDPMTLEFTTGRSMTNFVPLPRHIEARPGVLTIGIWIFAGAGHAAVCAPPPCPPCVYFDGTIGAGCLFDPFYRLIPAPEFDLAPRPNARDLKPTRSLQNPTGVVGTWLALDGKYPSTDRAGYGDVPWSLSGEVWAHIKSTKLFPVLIAVAGQDGIINTVDDRVLFIGGGRDHIDGGEPSEPSAEIVLIPKSPP